MTAVEDRAEEGGREDGGAEDEEFMSKESKRRVALRAEGGDADAEKDDAKATAAPKIQTWRKREFTTRKSAETPHVLHGQKTHHSKRHSTEIRESPPVQVRRTGSGWGGMHGGRWADRAAIAQSDAHEKSRLRLERRNATR